MTDELKNIAGECVNSPSNYSSAKPLAYRYNIFKKTATPERVLTYIKENLVE
jgi:hypothetical protein